MKDKKFIGENDQVNKIEGMDHNVCNVVKNMAEAKINQTFINNVKNHILNMGDGDGKKAAQDFVAAVMKNTIAKEKPEFYEQFKNYSYDDLFNKGLSQIYDTENGEGIKFFIQDGDGQLTSTSFEISPNSWWKNMTNILNDVSIGDNRISLGESFNAFDEFFVGNLESGEAILRTMGYSISGVSQLNQNMLVPDSTQMIAGYQASLGVFINVPSAMNVGGGKGFGLFTLYAAPDNVMKLATTQPQQLANIVTLFKDTALNTKTYVKWMVCTLNFLKNINNYIVDNANQNVRNCLNGTLFPAIQISKTPTNEFNCAIPTFGNVTDKAVWNAVGDLEQQIATNTANGWVQLNYEKLIDVTFMNSIKTTYKPIALQSPYLVQGSQQEPRIQAKLRGDVHLILTPRFNVVFKSGILSELFHYKFQNLEEYVNPENIHLLYKQVNIVASEMNTPITQATNGQPAIYNWQTPATLGNRWIPDNAIIVYYKGDDYNHWTANYYDVWYKEMGNMWGAGQISTMYLHFAFGGGVLPWANGYVVYMQNLLNTVSDGSEPQFIDFTLNSNVSTIPQQK